MNAAITLSNAIGRYKGLRWIEFNPLGPLPNYPCCYVVQLDGVSVYVGQTLGLRGRMHDHRPWLRSLTGHLRIKVRFADRYGDWAMREARLIRRLSPEFNRRAA